MAVREVPAALAMQLQWWMKYATTMGTPAILMVLVAMETTIENFLIVIVSQMICTGMNRGIGEFEKQLVR